MANSSTFKLFLRFAHKLLITKNRDLLNEWGPLALPRWESPKMAAPCADPGEPGAPRHIVRWSNTGFEKYAARG